MNASLAKPQNVAIAGISVVIAFLLCVFIPCLVTPYEAYAVSTVSTFDGSNAASNGALQAGALQDQGAYSSDVPTSKFAGAQEPTIQVAARQKLATQASTKKVALYVDSATQKSKKLTAKGLKAKKATWKTSNAKVVAVKAGKATAKKTGKATVTAKQGAKTFTFSITVKTVSISKKTVTIKVGATAKLKLKGDKIASAKSSDSAVATVTSAGKVSAIDPGKATITLTSKKGKSYTCEVTVRKLTATEAQAALNEGLDFWFSINGKTFNMAKARDLFRKAAISDNAEAWYWLGDVRRYDQDAGRWPEVLGFYQAAADAGSAYGYYGLGTLFETGYGVDKDTQKAISLYQQAADGGCLMGNVALGNLYIKSEGFDDGIALDGAKAEAFYTSALASADFQARNAARVGLGDMYRYARGVSADRAKALEWYQAAADDGYFLAYRRMGDTYRSDYGLTSANSQAEAEANAAQMISWYEKEAAGGFAYSLGEVYMNGIDVAADPARAREIFQKVLDEGDRSAAMSMCGLVLMNANGIGQAKDKAAAIEWCYKAIDACGPFDDSDNPNQRLHKPLPYARYVLEHYGQPLVRP